MKKVFSAIAAILFAAIALTSCGGNDVEKVVGIINDATEKINALEEGDTDGLDKVIEGMKPELEKYKESTQELTEADYTALATAIMNANAAMFHVAYGMPVPSAEETAEAVKNSAAELSEYKTLGEFVKIL